MDPRSSVRSACIGNEGRLPADPAGRMENGVNSHTSVFKKPVSSLLKRETQQQKNKGASSFYFPEFHPLFTHRRHGSATTAPRFDSTC